MDFSHVQPPTSPSSSTPTQSLLAKAFPAYNPPLLQGRPAELGMSSAGNTLHLVCTSTTVSPDSPKPPSRCYIYPRSGTMPISQFPPPSPKRSGFIDYKVQYMLMIKAEKKTQYAFGNRSHTVTLFPAPAGTTLIRRIGIIREEVMYSRETDPRFAHDNSG